MDSKGYQRKRSSIHSQGLFATQNFKEGGEIYRFPVGRKVLGKERELLTIEEQDRLEKRGEGTYELMEAPAWYVNHSCEPNCIEKNHVGYALRDIQSGEEITVDYGPNVEGGPMSCNCGSKKCRKILREK